MVEDWQRIIQVRSLVVTPHEDMRTWLKYASLCRRAGLLVRFLVPIICRNNLLISWSDFIVESSECTEIKRQGHSSICITFNLKNS